MPLTCAMAQTAWVALNLDRHRRFRRALSDPCAAQWAILRRILQRNADAEIGRRYRFDTIHSVREYQSRVPLIDYDNVASFIDRIRNGEENVLTCDRVRRLVPTSGSSSARKLIPYTSELQRQFNRAIGPWIVDLYRRTPALAGGPAYWSISPLAAFEDLAPSCVPIGFDDDTHYLGGWARRLVDCTLAVPSAVRFIRDIDSFRYVTLAMLLRRRELRLISVWHPSFLTLLIAPLTEHWDRLLQDVRDGTIRPPMELSRGVMTDLQRFAWPDRRRARELGNAAPTNLARIWPKLAMISCWGDASATSLLDRIRGEFPHADIQIKGLVATEGMVTIPFDGLRPLAITSHFFEFIASDGGVRLAHELEPGRRYSVVLTTAGGLYRYQLHDLVKVEGFVDQTPALSFVGREGGVSDLFGEKLSESFVAGTLRRVFAPNRIVPEFALLTPEQDGGRWRYVLHLECAQALPHDLAHDLETALSENPHYRYCVELGQLRRCEIAIAAPGALARYATELTRRGGRLGELKPTALDAHPRTGATRLLGDK